MGAPVGLVLIVTTPYAGAMKSVTSTEAKARLNALLAEVQRTGSPVTITTHGRPVAVLTPVESRCRNKGVGQLHCPINVGGSAVGDESRPRNHHRFTDGDRIGRAPARGCLHAAIESPHRPH